MIKVLVHTNIISNGHVTLYGYIFKVFIWCTFCIRTEEFCQSIANTVFRHSHLKAAVHSIILCIYQSFRTWLNLFIILDCQYWTVFTYIYFLILIDSYNWVGHIFLLMFITDIFPDWYYKRLYNCYLNKNNIIMYTMPNPKHPFHIDILNKETFYSAHSEFLLCKTFVFFI